MVASRQHAPPTVHAAARTAWYVSASVVFEQSTAGHAASAGSYWRAMAHPKHELSQSWNNDSSEVSCGRREQRGSELEKHVVSGMRDRARRGVPGLV